MSEPVAGGNGYHLSGGKSHHAEGVQEPDTPSPAFFVVLVIPLADRQALATEDLTRPSLPATASNVQRLSRDQTHLAA
jgi:hypothetical protein